MLHTKFQASKPSGFEEEKILEYFSMYFYGWNISPHSVGPCWIPGPPSEQTW